MELISKGDRQRERERERKREREGEGLRVRTRMLKEGNLIKKMNLPCSSSSEALN